MIQFEDHIFQMAWNHQLDMDPGIPYKKNGIILVVTGILVVGFLGLSDLSKRWKMCRPVQLLISRVIDPFSNSMRFICVPSQNSGSYWDKIGLDGKIHRKNVHFTIVCYYLIGSFSNLNWSFEVAKYLGYPYQSWKNMFQMAFFQAGRVNRSPFQVWGFRSWLGHFGWKNPGTQSTREIHWIENSCHMWCKSIQIWSDRVVMTFFFYFDGIDEKHMEKIVRVQE